MDDGADAGACNALEEAGSEAGHLVQRSAIPALQPQRTHGMLRRQPLRSGSTICRTQAVADMVAMKPPARVVGDSVQPQIDERTSGQRRESPGKPCNVLDESSPFRTGLGARKIAERLEARRRTGGRTDEMPHRQAIRRQSVEPALETCDWRSMPDGQRHLVVADPTQDGLVCSFDDPRRSRHDIEIGADPPLGWFVMRRFVTRRLVTGLKRSAHGTSISRG